MKKSKKLKKPRRRPTHKTAGTKALAIKRYNIDKPQELKSMALVLKDHVVRNNLYTKIAGRNYAHVEGWQFAGGLLGLYPKVEKVENLSSGQEIKWLAQVDIINSKNEEVVATGFAVCSNKEGKKTKFDEYAILSMAQTRAIGKAYRNLLGWVMKLAGYQPMPAEEARNIGGKEVKVEEPRIEIDVDAEPETEEVGVPEEISQIQKTLAELGYKSPSSQLYQVQRFAAKEGFKFDSWRMTRSQAKKLLAKLLQIKLEKSRK
jgi:hypothetical protein